MLTTLVAETEKMMIEVAFPSEHLKVLRLLQFFKESAGYALLSFLCEWRTK